MTDIKTFDGFEFHGDRLPVIVRDGQPWMLFGLVAEGFDLDWQRELERLPSQYLLNGHVVGRLHAATGLTVYEIAVEAIPAWLMGVCNDRVPAARKGKHLLYCKDLVRAVFSYTTGGVAINAALIDAEGRARIEAAATEARARAQYLHELRLAADQMERLCPGDHAAVAYGRTAVKRQLALAAGDTGLAAGTPVVIATGLASELGFRPTPGEESALGQAIAAAWRQRPENAGLKNPPRTQYMTAFGRPLVGSEGVFCYRPEDKPWMAAVIRHFYSGRTGGN